jgi:uncharacterized protein
MPDGGLHRSNSYCLLHVPHFWPPNPIGGPRSSNLDAYALGHQYSRRADLLRDAEDVVRYVDRFLTSPDGTFYTNQDADVGSHDDRAKFVDGNAYYPKTESERLKLGIPWVDSHVYAHENGLMIAALVRLYEATRDERVLARARRAADRLLASHVDADGSVRREKDSASPVRFLVDAASFGRACARLALVTREPRYRDAALRIASRMNAALLDASTSAYFAHGADPGASGVFSRPRRPFRHNVLAARFLTALSAATGDATFTAAARRTLAAIATPQALDGQGRVLGGYLLALHEAGIRPASR